jgi:hypothetical protein
MGMFQMLSQGNGHWSALRLVGNGSARTGSARHTIVPTSTTANTPFNHLFLMFSSP